MLKNLKEHLKSGGLPEISSSGSQNRKKKSNILQGFFFLQLRDMNDK